MSPKPSVKAATGVCHSIKKFDAAGSHPQTWHRCISLNYQVHHMLFMDILPQGLDALKSAQVWHFYAGQVKCLKVHGSVFRRPEEWRLRGQGIRLRLERSSQLWPPKKVLRRPELLRPGVHWRLCIRQPQRFVPQL